VLLVLLMAVGFGFLADFGAAGISDASSASAKGGSGASECRFGGLYVELAMSPMTGRKVVSGDTEHANSNPDAPLYVMLIPARVFEQTGMTWREVPSTL